MNPFYGTENYQLVPPFLENGLAALQVDLNEDQVELLASKEQQMILIYCSQYPNTAYRFYWRVMRLTPHSLAYQNRR